MKKIKSIIPPTLMHNRDTIKRQHQHHLPLPAPIGIQFYPDQCTMKSFYNPETILRRWYSDGGRWIECDYTAGKRHGTYRSWYTTGQPSQESHWIDGKRYGSNKMWNLAGNLIVHDYWIEGKRTQTYVNKLLCT
jgi:hypothetical protein